MSFEAKVRSHLEAIDAKRLDVPRRHRSIDRHDLRSHLLRRLETLRHDPGRDPHDIRYFHAFWSEQLPELVAYLERLPEHAAPLDTRRATRLARAVIDEDLPTLRVHQGAPPISEFEASVVLWDFLNFGATDQYVLETRLAAQATNDTLHVTALGRVLLRLRGRDAIRWMLTLEVVQSTGHMDRWRMCNDALVDAMPPGGIDALDFRYGNLTYPTQAARRLFALGILTDVDPDALPASYVVVPEMREVVAAVIEDGPWHAAVRAMLEDERAASVPALGGTRSVVDATIEQTRMITHEVRNALVPVRHHLDALAVALDPSRKVRWEAARRGVVRVLDFVDEMVATAELMTEPSTTVDLAAVVGEALDRVDGAEAVASMPPDSAVSIHGPRNRLVTAIANVLQNALQAAGDAPVRLSWRREASEVRINVDDGGPGVKGSERARVFDDGYTTKPGGTGFGLAFVRGVVEGALHGKVWCEDSDLGGARFVIAIPSEPRP